MIVIATNNGFDYLEKCLKSCKNYTVNIPVLVVDTGSSNEFKELGKSLALKYGAQWTESEPGGYDYGAYIHAYKNFEADWYWFQHDSVCFKNYSSIKLIEKQIRDGKACAWTSFVYYTCPYDNEEQANWVKSITDNTYYDFGCFGPNFGISRNHLNTIDSIFNLSNIKVDTKIKQQAMERCWPIMFKMSNIYFTWLENTSTQTFWRDFHEDHMIYFTKQLHKEGPRK